MVDFLRVGDLVTLNRDVLRPDDDEYGLEGQQGIVLQVYTEVSLAKIKMDNNGDIKNFSLKSLDRK